MSKAVTLNTVTLDIVILKPVTLITKTLKIVALMKHKQ